MKPEITIPPGQIDDYLKRYRYPCRFILDSGIYTTKGIWNFFPNFDGCMLPPGAELIGQGSSLTEIRFQNTVNTVNGVSAQYHNMLTAGNRTSGSKVLPADDCKIVGITLNCESNLPTIGIQAWTSHAHIEDVIVKNIWGNVNSKMEGFGILINNSGNETNFDGGHVIRDCKVYTKPDAYVTAIYVGCLKRKIPLETSIIENCKALCYFSTGSKHSHAAFGMNSSLIMNGCESSGFNNVIFNDTGNTENVQINNGVFQNVGYAYMALRANQSGWIRKNIKTKNCLVEFSNTRYDHVAVLVCDDQSSTKNMAMMKNIIIDDCIIQNNTNANFYYGSINGSLFKNIGIKNSILPKSNLGVVIAGPSTSSVWIDEQNILQ